jgi:hypothetical protein
MTHIYEKKLVKDDVLTDVICNRCKKSTSGDGGYDFLDLWAQWGYGSEWDCQRWTAHLCIDCTKELVKLMGDFFDKEMCDVSGDVICSLAEYEKRMDEIKGAK